MNQQLKDVAGALLKDIETAGLTKPEHVMSTRQGTVITADGREVINFCANNYLGLSGRDELVEAAKRALDTYGYGLSSVRFICGVQTIHKELERGIADFLEKESATLFGSCWAANEAVFAVLLTEEDAVISDELSHASIVDGVRLCKAERHVFKHMDMSDLEEKLQATQGKRLRCVVTDGVFSMDGDVAPLKEICDLAERYNAYVVVDDSHATGFLGENGRGSAEHCGVGTRVDIITTTFGKALGGASGGCIAGPKEFTDLLYQRARTSLFTNSLPPVITATTLFVLEFLHEHPELREALWENTAYFRQKMTDAGFTVPASVHPIIPVMIGDGKAASDMAQDMLGEGIYVIGFSYPVVPLGRARIRVQISAAHTREQIDQLVAAFTKLAAKYAVGPFA